MLDDESLRAKFKVWHDSLDADVILRRVHDLQAELTSKDQGELCRRWLYAKNFYPQVVHTVLNRLLGLKSLKDRRNSILRFRSIPEDLNELWNAMGLNP